MTSPPGIARVAEPSAGYSRDRIPDLSTKQGQKRYLMDGLGVSGPQAKALVKAYERDVADARRVGNDTDRSDASFIDWLMRQSPSQRTRQCRKYRLGESGWRTRS